MATTSIDGMAKITREEIAHRELAEAWADVQTLQRRAEQAMVRLEKAIRAERDVNGLEVGPGSLNAGFQTLWEQHRIRLMVEASEAA